MKRLNRLTDTFRELITYYLCIIAVGSTVFHFAEGKALWDSIWWTFVTSMTVGYGDIYPVTIIGRIDAIILMHVVPLFIAPLVVTRLVERMLDDRDKFTHEEQLELLNNVRDIKKKLDV